MKMMLHKQTEAKMHYFSKFIFTVKTKLVDHLQRQILMKILKKIFLIKSFN